MAKRNNTASTETTEAPPEIVKVKRVYAADNLTEAIIYVMDQVSSIEKKLTVGEGKNAYQGVGDKDVKLAMSKAFIEAGLIILPVKITHTTNIRNWVDGYGNSKQQVFTEVITQYKLKHISGDFEILEGLGQGVDSMDKSAGKATTYALKYTLLYTFLVATGKIDDADKTHSGDIIPPAAVDHIPLPPADTRTVLKTDDAEGFTKAVDILKNGLEGKTGSIELVQSIYKISKNTIKALQDAIRPKDQPTPTTPAPAALKKKKVLEAGTPDYENALSFLINGDGSGKPATITRLEARYIISDEIKNSLTNAVNTPA